MQAGDCVLQPPLIRHRVLESSDGLEVIEIGAPAEHMTYLDHKMSLPTGNIESARDYSGQRYTFYKAKNAQWDTDSTGIFLESDLGIKAATNGLVNAKVLRADSTSRYINELTNHNNALAFWFVLAGRLVVDTKAHKGINLETGDSLVIPAGLLYGFVSGSDDLELLEISVSE